ncbi:MAG: 4-oxalomesaconate tautomerase [Pseudomonadota bacterium]
MGQLAFPYVFMRAGTSRGPYFRREDLPNNLDALAEILIGVIGSGHHNNIDGIGGGTAVTTKVAMLSQAQDGWADIDYFFAQVSVDDRIVDFKPTCGNILAGVGPAALELGLMQAQGEVTEIKIHACNTGARVIAHVQTPGGVIDYAGSCAIAGVLGTAAPIHLEFLDVVGSSTGEFLPTGNLVDTIDDVDVTCMDVAMPMVIARASDFGLRADESMADLDQNAQFFAKMEKIRIAAGALMGMEDVTKSVIPKFAIVAQPHAGGNFSARYFMPWKTHPGMAVTGGQCLATCYLTPGTVMDGLRAQKSSSPTNIAIEHPSGVLDVMMHYEFTDRFILHSAGLVRTARKLADGYIYAPNDHH